MIAGGCLSPLLAALMLTPLDQAMGAAGRSGGIGYIRYMDDFIVWTRQDKTRHSFKRVIKATHRLVWGLNLGYINVKSVVSVRPMWGLIF